MAAAADTAEGVPASKSGRALAFACSFTACLLAAGALAITLLGHPGGGATASLELDIPATGHAKPAAASSVSDEQLTGDPITGPVFAGRVLVADPALIENSKYGPLPRIADDGRKPMSVYAAPAPAGAKFKIAVVVNASAARPPPPKPPWSVCLPASPWALHPMPGMSGNGRRKPANAAMKCCCRFPWSLPIFPKAIPVRTRCAQARKRKPISSA